MGITDNGAKVATTAIETFKSSPMTLALLLMNLALLGVVYFVSTSHTAERQRLFELIMTDQKQVQELLARCVVRSERGDAVAPTTPPT